MFEQDNLRDGLATRKMQLTGKQPADEIEEDPVMEDIPSSDGGWIEDLDEEVPALRKLSDGENESDDASAEDETEFNYDESFLSTADEGAEDETANGLEPTSHPEVTSSPRQNAPTSYCKGFFVESKGFTDYRFQVENKKCPSGEGVNDNVTLIGNVTKPETASQTRQISKEVKNSNLVLKLIREIDSLDNKQERGTKETQGSTTTSEPHTLASTEKTVFRVSLLPSEEAVETQSSKKEDAVSNVFNINGRNIRIRRQNQELKPKDSDYESNVERNRNPDGELSTKTPGVNSPGTRSLTLADSEDKLLMLNSSKVTVGPMNKPVGMGVKGTNPRSEMKVGSELVLEGKSVDSGGKVDGHCMVTNAGVNHKNAALKFKSIGNTSDQEQQEQQIRHQPGSNAEDTMISSNETSGNIEGTKKHYPSVNEYVQDLKLMMKEKGIKSMVLKGPKKVITDVTKQLNDSKKYLFRLDGSKTRGQHGNDCPLSVLKLNKSPNASCVSISQVESKDETLKKDVSSTTSSCEVLSNSHKVSPTKGQRSDSTELKTGLHSTPPNLVRDSALISVKQDVNESVGLPNSQAADVFKALSILNLVQAPKPSACVSQTSAADQANEKVPKTTTNTVGPATGNTVINALGSVNPSSWTNAPPCATQTDTSALTKTVGLENTKTITAVCSTVPSEFVGNDIGKEKTTRITRSMACPLASDMITRSQAKTPPPQCNIEGKTVSIKPTEDNSPYKGGRVLRSGVSPQTSSSALPSGIRTPETKDSSIVIPSLPTFVAARSSRSAAPPLQPKRKDLFRYVVLCPDGQRKILVVPGGIPVQVSNALSGKPLIVECKSDPCVSAVKDDSIAGKPSADKEIVEVTNEVLPSGIKLKRVKTRARSPAEHVEGPAIEPDRSETKPEKRLLMRINESKKQGKNLVSNSDGSMVFIQTSANAIDQPTLTVGTATGVPPGPHKSKRVSESSPLNDEKKNPCESKGDSVNSSSTLRRSRRERKVARPYSPPPEKRRKMASSSSPPVTVDAPDKKSCNQKRPACHSSERREVDSVKGTEVQHVNESSDHTKSDPAKEGGDKLDAIIPLKRVKIVIKSEPLSDDEATDSTEPCPNLAECNTIKTEPGSDSDSTDIPTDSDDDNSNGYCQRNAKLKGLVAETSSAEGTGELPKVSETHHLSRAEQMRLLKQRIEEQEMMLENIQKQRHQLLMERLNNPYLQDLY